MRRRNEVLEAQVSVVQVFAAALGLHRNSGGMSLDVAWELQKKIDELGEKTATAEEYAGEPGNGIGGCATGTPGIFPLSSKPDAKPKATGAKAAFSNSAKNKPA